MGISGAVVYSLVLIGRRQLARLFVLTNRSRRSAWHACLDGAARYGGSLSPVEQAESQRSHAGR
jgi:hypothetical protein